MQNEDDGVINPSTDLSLAFGSLGLSPLFDVEEASTPAILNIPDNRFRLPSIDSLALGSRFPTREEQTIPRLDISEVLKKIGNLDDEGPSVSSPGSNEPLSVISDEKAFYEEIRQVAFVRQASAPRLHEEIIDEMAPMDTKLHAASPINTIPQELLVEILEWVAHTNPDGPLVLMGISRLWNTLVETVPTLWTCIVFRQDWEDDIFRFQLGLVQSRGAPLDVSLYLWTLEQEIESVIRACADRCEYLTVYLPDDSVRGQPHRSSDLLKSLLDIFSAARPKSNLKSLVIRNDNKAVGALALPCFPALKELRLYNFGVEIGHEPETLSKLKTSITHVGTLDSFLKSSLLTSLDLSITEDKSPEFDLDNQFFLQWLSNCNLVDLKIDWIGVQANYFFQFLRSLQATSFLRTLSLKMIQMDFSTTQVWQPSHGQRPKRLTSFNFIAYSFIGSAMIATLAEFFEYCSTLTSCSLTLLPMIQYHLSQAPRLLSSLAKLPNLQDIAISIGIWVAAHDVLRRHVHFPPEIEAVEFRHLLQRDDIQERDWPNTGERQEWVVQKPIMAQDPLCRLDLDTVSAMLHPDTLTHGVFEESSTSALSFESLKTLRVGGNPNTFSNTHIFPIFRCHFPVLRDLNLILESSTNRLFADTFKDFIQRCTNIESISMSLESKDLLVDLGRCPSLKNLSVSHSVDLDVLHMQFPHLTTLAMDGLSIPTDEITSTSLLVSLPGLTALTIEDNYTWNDIGFLLTMLPALQHLTVLMNTVIYNDLTLLDECVDVLTLQEDLGPEILSPQLKVLTTNAYPLDWNALIWMVKSRSSMTIESRSPQVLCKSLSTIGLPGLPHPVLLRSLILALRGLTSWVDFGAPDGDPIKYFRQRTRQGGYCRECASAGWICKASSSAECNWRRQPVTITPNWTIPTLDEEYLS